MGHLSFSSIFTAISNFMIWKPNPDIDLVTDEDHRYIRGDADNRGPCPALNSLANHGYLPRDGKNISLNRVKAALIVGLKMTPALAAVQATNAEQVLGPDGTFDLRDTRKHDLIEHDASLTRFDFRQGDNYSFQPDMFKAYLEDAKGGPITSWTLAKTRVRRDREEKLAGVPSMSFSLWITKWAQTAFVPYAFGPSVSREDITTFYTEERLPQNALDSRKTLTFPGFFFAVLVTFLRSLIVRFKKN